MFKNRILNFGLFLGMIFGFASCNKDATPIIVEEPIINIVAPAINLTFSLTAIDSILLHIQVEDNDGLHLVVTNIYNQGGINVFKQADHVDNMQYQLQKYFMPEKTNAECTYKLRIDAEDHSGHTANKIIWFTVNP